MILLVAIFDIHDDGDGNSNCNDDVNSNFGGDLC